MTDQLPLNGVAVLSDWLDQESPSLELVKRHYPGGLPQELLNYVQKEVSSYTGRQVNYSYRETNYLRQVLQENTGDFLHALKECNWFRLRDLLTESEYLLHCRARNGLRLLYSLDPEVYIRLVNEQLQPLWLFPLFRPEEQTVDIVNLLNPELQAVFCIVEWEALKQSVQDGGAADTVIFERLHAKLPSEQLLVMFGYILEELLRESLERNRIDKLKESLKPSYMVWLAEYFGRRVLNDEEVELFLIALTGRVNRESWVGALYIANKLVEQSAEIAQHNADLLRKKVLNEYPNLWVRESSKDDKTAYFSGERSVELAQELARTFCISRVNPLEELLVQAGVSRPESLWKLRNAHDYGGYLNKRKLTLAHLLVIAIVVERHYEQEGHFPEQWTTFLNQFLNYCRQWSGHNLSEEELIMQELLARVASLLQKSGQLTDIAPTILSYLPVPQSTVFILRYIDSQQYVLMEEMLEQYLITQLPALRINVLIEVVKNLYFVQAYKLCVRFFNYVPFDDFIGDPNKAFYLAKLYVSAILNTVQYGHQTEDHIASCREAIRIMECLRTKYEYKTDTQFDLLWGYLLGWIAERDLVNPITLDRYLRLTEGERTGDPSSPYLAYARAGIAVKLVSVEKESYIQILEDSLTKAKDAPGVEGVVWLMDAWLSGIHQDSTRRLRSLQQAKAYAGQIRELRDSFPQRLIKLADAVLDGEPYDPE